MEVVFRKQKWTLQKEGLFREEAKRLRCCGKRAN